MVFMQEKQLVTRMAAAVSFIQKTPRLLHLPPTKLEMQVYPVSILENTM